MKQVSLIAFIGCAIVILLRIFGFISQLQWITSEYFGEYSRNLLFDSAAYQIATAILGIAAWCLIGSFFFVLYKKQPK